MAKATLMICLGAVCSMVVAGASGAVGRVGAAGDRWSHIGSLAIGMPQDVVTHDLGKGVVRMQQDGSQVITYVFPSDLARQLRNRPVPAQLVRYSTLVILVNDQAVTAISLTQGGAGTIPKRFKGVPLDYTLKQVWQVYGKPSRWNNSHDTAFFEPRPLSLTFDDSQHVYAISIGKDRSAEQNIPAVALTFTRRRGSKLVSGFRVVPPS